MSVTGVTVSPSLLFGGSATASDLLSTVLSGATASRTAATGSNPLVALKLAQANQAKDIAAEAKDPQVSRDVAAFRKAVSGAKSIEAALSNPAVLKVLLTANGLGDQVAYPALATKALLSDPADSTGLASKLSASNANWLAAAKTFDFHAKGLAALTDPAVQATLANGYAEVRWRQSLDSGTPGLSNALTFLDNASGIKNVDQILGDPVNRDVVLTALGIPLQVAFQPLTSQEKAVTSRLDVSRLQDKGFVQAFAQRYLLNKNSAGSSGTASGVVSLLA